MEIILASVAIGISLVSLYISYLNRKNALRETIFKEQVEASKRIYTVLNTLDNLFISIHIYEEPEEKRALIEKFFYESDRLQDEVEISILFFDDDIDKSLTKQLGVISDISGKLIKGEEVDKQEFNDAIFDIQFVLHEMLGIHKLSRENRRLSRSDRFSI